MLSAGGADVESAAGASTEVLAFVASDQLEHLEASTRGEVVVLPSSFIHEWSATYAHVYREVKLYLARVMASSVRARGAASLLPPGVDTHLRAIIASLTTAASPAGATAAVALPQADVTVRAQLAARALVAFLPRIMPRGGAAQTDSQASALPCGLLLHTLLRMSVSVNKAHDKVAHLHDPLFDARLAKRARKLVSSLTADSEAPKLREPLQRMLATYTSGKLLAGLEAGHAPAVAFDLLTAMECIARADGGAAPWEAQRSRVERLVQALPGADASGFDASLFDAATRSSTDGGATTSGLAGGDAPSRSTALN
ncbi:MAG: hypothetical protein EOO41_05710, partial [Methanobacteriota archaeon]